MANPDRPNLFSYATSELSQDAFICWLAAWADPKFQAADPELYQTAREFIVSLIHKQKPDYDVEIIKTVKVKRQVEKLDILIEINKEGFDGKLAILIEDKTHTDHHDDQLDRYYTNTLENYSPEQIIPIYFKTGYQSKFDVGRYKTYLREEFLTLLKAGSYKVKNAIYNDFLAHLEHMEYVVNQFFVKNLLLENGDNAWEINDWRGFFMHLYKERKKLYDATDNDGANWNYIANPTGGFFGFWWYFRTIQNGIYTPYLQLENHELCFKVEVKDELKRAEAREEAYRKLIEAANGLGLTSIKRPGRMGNGRYMTVLRWDRDYRESANGKLDFNATLENLKKAQQILDAAFLQ